MQAKLKFRGVALLKITAPDLLPNKTIPFNLSHKHMTSNKDWTEDKLKDLKTL